MNGAAGDSLACHLVAALAPWRGESLLSRGAIEAICRSQAGALPAATSSLCGVECRLGNPAPDADMLVRIGPAPEEWAVLERWAVAGDGATWGRIAELLRRRAAADSPLAAALRNMWLEWDLAAQPAGSADPSAFFGTDRLVGGATAAWAVEAVSLLRGAPVPAPMAGGLQGLVARLPPAARLFQIGVMCARPQAPLRVCLIGMTPEAVPAVLAAVGWPGEIEAVSVALSRFAAAIHHVALDLDLDDTGRLARKLGLELYVGKDAGAGQRLVALIQALLDEGLCLPNKATGLLAWGGMTHHRLFPGLWPAGLPTRRDGPEAVESSTFCRWLHHVKLVLQPGQATEAKAYLAIAHAYVSDAALRKVLRDMTIARLDFTASTAQPAV